MDDQSIETRVVIVFPGALGDFLLALPALRALRARHGGAFCTLVVGEPLRALATLAGIADAIESLDSGACAGLFGGEHLPTWLVGRPVVYSWLGRHDRTMRARLAAVAQTARFFGIERGDGRTHATVAYLRAVGGVAPRGGLARMGSLVTPPSRAARRLCATAGGPILAVHRGAGARTKRWDEAGFTRLERWWRARGGAVVAIVGPAEDADPGPDLPEVRDWPLPDLAALLASVALYCGNDSGVSHLAGAVGAAGAVLFGPTDPRRWRPLGGRLAALRASGAAGAPISLVTLPATRVVAALRRRSTLTRWTPEISLAR